jgi:hypothetical protein
MMADAHLEYVGFTTQGTQREYTLRLKRPGVADQEFILAIPLAAFTARRARFQDAPDICFRKLQRELTATPESLPAVFQSVTDLELDEYHLATAPRAPTRRRKPIVPVEATATEEAPPPRRWL